jgi:hypothetical protein
VDQRGRGMSEHKERARLRGTHTLLNIERRTSQGTKRKQESNGHSHPVDQRGETSQDSKRK